MIRRIIAEMATPVAEQQVFDALNAVHTQALDGLSEDHPLVGVLSEALDAAIAACPNLRI